MPRIALTSLALLLAAAPAGAFTSLAPRRVDARSRSSPITMMPIGVPKARAPPTSGLDERAATEPPSVVQVAYRSPGAYQADWVRRPSPVYTDPPTR